MKRHFILSALIASALLALHIACSADDESRIASVHPGLSSTTRMTETVQSTIDPIVTRVEAAAAGVKSVAADASGAGIPGAGTVALIAGVIGTFAGVYNERRRGTLPLRSAITQIVQSVESAFPAKTDSQKSAMAAVQDSSTKLLVQQIKGA